MDRLNAHLQKIEKILGSEEPVPWYLEDKLEWHLQKIEALLSGGGGSAAWGEIKGNIEDQTDLQGVVDDLALSIAPDYDNTLTYNLNDLCMYNGRLYKCIEAIETAEE